MCVDFIWEWNQDYLASHQMSWSSGCRWKSLCLQPLLLLSFTTSTPSESGLESTLVNPDEVKLKMSSTGDQIRPRVFQEGGAKPKPSKLERARQREEWHHLLSANGHQCRNVRVFESCVYNNYHHFECLERLLSGNHLSYIIWCISHQIGYYSVLICDITFF